MQQYYGLNLDGMGEDYTRSHAAALVAQLPEESRCRRALRPEPDPWGDVEYMLRDIHYFLHCLCYRGTEDAKHGRNRPRPIESPRERLEKAEEIRVADPRGVAEALGIPEDRL